MSFTYRGLKALQDRHIVTAEEIEQQMERLQQQTPKITVITDRPAQMGDEVVLDFAGFCDGEQFAGGTAKNHTLVLGSGMFIPGFEEQLAGKNLEEEVIVKVTFPEKYTPELAGKDAEFHCVMHQIRVKTAYELDDTFAQEVGGCETYVEMCEKMGQSLQAYVDERGEMDLQDRLLRQAATSLELEITEEQLKAGVEEQMQVLEAQLAQQGLNLDMYCKFMNITREDIREEAVPAARDAIRTQAAVDKIVELEGLKAEESDLQEAYAVIARQNGITMEQLKPHMDDQFKATVARSVLMSKVMRLIRDSAEITESV